MTNEKYTVFVHIRIIYFGYLKKLTICICTREGGRQRGTSYFKPNIEMKDIEGKSQILDKESGLKCEKYSATNASILHLSIHCSVTGD